ncbi:hypothetical protein EYF80_032643 [Liparis tanakae]|uniref:Uncharacterized protein n=1 Tax=Liparis tanakae TaxID=230148 RepID=A0A4Z2GV76_9TELE|nr:hypothetical protein EYF80_032643 [Liparis tanakae]
MKEAECTKHQAYIRRAPRGMLPPWDTIPSKPPRLPVQMCDAGTDLGFRCKAVAAGLHTLMDIPRYLTSTPGTPSDDDGALRLDRDPRYISNVVKRTKPNESASTFIVMD